MKLKKLLLASLFALPLFAYETPFGIHIERVKKGDTGAAQQVQEQVSAQEKLKIAIILPSQIIGRYASSTTNAVFAYMFSKQIPFEIKTFDIQTQENERLSQALQEIKNEGFSYAIAVLTKEGVEKLIALDPQINIFIPTINKNEVSSSSSHLYFGGIDYKAQVDTLLKNASTPLVIFKDASAVSHKLSEYAQSKSHGKNYLFTIDKSNNVKKQLRNRKLKHGSFLTNTPVVKTGVIISQMTLLNVKEKNILSTQINYDPLLLSMTQYNDRNNMIIANSITKDNTAITDANLLLNNDITYDWINYATTIGSDLFFSHITHEAREYPLAIVNNQILYPITLVQPSFSSFVNYKSKEK